MFSSVEPMKRHTVSNSLCARQRRIVVFAVCTLGLALLWGLTCDSFQGSSKPSSSDEAGQHLGLHCWAQLEAPLWPSFCLLFLGLVQTFQPIVSHLHPSSLFEPPRGMPPLHA